MTMFGDIFIKNSEDACYTTSSPLFTPVASTTDFWEMKYGGTKTIFLLELWLLYVATAESATQDVVYLLRRSTAASGGTAVANTAVYHDTTSGAPGAVVRHFTANPATGTLVGNIMASAINPAFPGTGASIINTLPGQCIYRAQSIQQALKLVASGQAFTLNSNGTKPGGTSPQLSVKAVWKEV